MGKFVGNSTEHAVSSPNIVKNGRMSVVVQVIDPTSWMNTVV